LPAEGAENNGFAARCLLRAARAGTLATQTEDKTPFASLVTPAIAADGAVLMLLSSLAAHTRHLRADPQCALMVMGQAENENPQTAPRVTITGRAEPAADPALRRFWVDAVAAVAQAQQRILAHCNADHADALKLMARAQGHGGDWRMLSVDIDGFDMVQDDSVLRINFDAPVADAAGVRAALVRLVEAAR
jgi:putative heme iron utilization protein